jgi:hypothetical protein
MVFRKDCLTLFLFFSPERRRGAGNGRLSLSIQAKIVIFKVSFDILLSPRLFSCWRTHCRRVAGAPMGKQLKILKNLLLFI